MVSDIYNSQMYRILLCMDYQLLMDTVTTLQSVDIIIVIYMEMNGSLNNSTVTGCNYNYVEAMVTCYAWNINI